MIGNKFSPLPWPPFGVVFFGASLKAEVVCLTACKLKLRLKGRGYLEINYYRQEAGSMPVFLFLRISKCLPGRKGPRKSVNNIDIDKDDKLTI